MGVPLHPLLVLPSTPEFVVGVRSAGFDRSGWNESSEPIVSLSLLLTSYTSLGRPSPTSTSVYSAYLPRQTRDEQSCHRFLLKDELR